MDVQRGATAQFQRYTQSKRIPSAHVRRRPRARPRRTGHAVAPYARPMVDLPQYLSDCKFILVSNREPYEHVRGERGIEVKQPAGGLVSRARSHDATHPRNVGRVGIGHRRSRNVRRNGPRQVPPGEESYTLRRVWLDEARRERLLPRLRQSRRCGRSATCSFSTSSFARSTGSAIAR